MSDEGTPPQLPENDSTCENEQHDQDKTVDNSELTVVSLLGRIFPTSETELVPLAQCESVYPYDEDEPVSKDANASEKKSPTKKWYLQVGLAGVYAINNYLYEREKTWLNSRGERVVYLKCTKFRLLNCRNARAVLIIAKDGTKKIRRCCEDEEHTHPPPFAEVVKRNVKLKLKALVERFPEKTVAAIYEQVVREETLAYSEIDPAFSKFIPKFGTVRSYLHRERQRIREERGMSYPKRPKRTNTTVYETVEVHGLNKSSLPKITNANSVRSNENIIKEEIIFSCDENSCADDPIEAAVRVPDRTSDEERNLDPSVPNSPVITNSASISPVQQNHQQSNVIFESPTPVGVLQANPDCTISSIVSINDQNSYAVANTSQAYCDQVNFQNRFDHLAKNWSEKLKILRNDQRIYAEKLINDVLYEAELCLLNHGCQIYNAS